jgi:hypothetical protein
MYFPPPESVAPTGPREAGDSYSGALAIPPAFIFHI